jgi:hypothetical protein
MERTVKPTLTESDAAMADAAPTETAHRSRLISKVLSPAVRLWLRSQVEQIETLTFQIEGGDRQLLSGYIPTVAISASKAVYQGLHLSQIQLTGSNIRVNLGQVLRGKPLRLLEVVPIRGELLISQADLNASLQAPLLATALTEFLTELLRSQSSDLIETSESEPLNLQNPEVLIEERRLTLRANLVSVSGTLTPLAIRTGLLLVNGNCLQLDHPVWLPHPTAKRGLPLDDLHGFQIDLGSDVALEELAIEPERLVCRGSINVVPE